MKNVVQHAPQAGRGEAEKGIIAPQPELLKEGAYIYRFASHKASLGYHAGSWWIREPDLACSPKVDPGAMRVGGA
jgi:hypothetical protein